MHQLQTLHVGANEIVGPGGCPGRLITACVRCNRNLLQLLIKLVDIQPGWCISCAVIAAGAAEAEGRAVAAVDPTAEALTRFHGCRVAVRDTFSSLQECRGEGWLCTGLLCLISVHHKEQGQLQVRSKWSSPSQSLFLLREWGIRKGSIV